MAAFLVRFFLAVCLVSAVAGCASLPHGGMFAASDGGRGSDIANDQTLFVVTTRKAVNGGRVDPWFGADRANQLSIAQVRLVSPAQAGRFSLAATGLVDWQVESVEPVPVLSVGQPSAGSSERRDVLLYVHGYNQTFASATLDAARLADGLSFHGDTVLFSWPSRNKLLDYIRDRESAIWSRDAFETTLSSLLANPSIGRIHIVAHSMGSMLTIEGLRQVYAQQGDAIADRFGAIVFASPDLDIDSFAASVTRMRRLAPKLTIITAADDRAIAIAARMAGGNRIGPAEKARLESIGLKVIDASGLGWGMLNHDLFLTNAKVKGVIRQAIESAGQAERLSGVSAQAAPFIQ